MEEIKAYKCSKCGRIFELKDDAELCEFQHNQFNLGNQMLKEGRCLQDINCLCNFGWELREDLKKVTKDNCFCFPHWQGCAKPAYQINKIICGGVFNLKGKGSSSSYFYEQHLLIQGLPHPHSEHELYIA